ncbi:hypothetical protein PR048_011899 [Dryococelus australis]|uniref:Uncharacterized protein n=1 Tax=Dryococelus australis TaxID=614101 RepID=A0ABQ9HMY3_9NEOP|nr:hypothetical protein PR048_011899 [Dryococelus australis]
MPKIPRRMLQFKKSNMYFHERKNSLETAQLKVLHFLPRVPPRQVAAGPSHAPDTILTPTNVHSPSSFEGEVSVVTDAPTEEFPGAQYSVFDICKLSSLLDESIIQQLLGRFYDESMVPVLHVHHQPPPITGRVRPRQYCARTYCVARNDLYGNVPAHDMGVMNHACSHCGALFFHGEGIKRDDTFTMCCMHGQIHLDPLGDAPELLQHFLTVASAEDAEYRAYIRNYNSALSFASFCADGIIASPSRSVYTFKIHGQVHHLTSGTAHPVEGSDPIYSQLYFIDVDQANVARVQKHNLCQLLILEQLKTLLIEINPLAQIHKTMRQMLESEELQAEQCNCPVKEVT